VTVHEYDIILDVMVINQTDETLQNLSVELSTVGDLRLCGRPQATNLAAHSTRNISANIKVSSTETGIIFGSIVWDEKTDQGNVILNDIHIDIMDYISPASCSELSFRSMWAEFEWENKVAINTAIDDEHEYRERVTQPAPSQEDLLELKRTLAATLGQADRSAAALAPFVTAGSPVRRLQELTRRNLQLHGHEPPQTPPRSGGYLGPD